jgi:hypothetical protein
MKEKNFLELTQDCIRDGHTELNLSGKRTKIGYIGYEELNKICELLKTNQTIKKLNLSHNDIGDEGAIILTEMLKINETIQDVLLFDTNIGDEGGKAILEILQSEKVSVTGFLPVYNKIYKYNTKIKDSISNQIASKDFFNSFKRDLENPKYLEREELNWTLCGVGDDSIKLLCPYLKNNNKIKILELGGNPIGDEGAHELAQMLKVNTSINVVYLRGDKITDKGAKCLLEVLKGKETLNVYIDGNEEISESIANEIDTLNENHKKPKTVEENNSKLITANDKFESETPIISQNKFEESKNQSIELTYKQLIDFYLLAQKNSLKESLNKVINNEKEVDSLLDYCDQFVKQSEFGKEDVVPSGNNIDDFIDDFYN